MESIKSNIKYSVSYIAAFAKWVILAVTIGVIGGLLGSLFHLSIDYVTELRASHFFLIYLLPIG